MHYLYRITNTTNGKIYIGQTNKPQYRWYQHRSYAKGEKPQQYIHRAMAKYGIENFIFEVIATCKTQADADDTESLLIKRYDSRNKKYGYNLMIGGSYGGHSEESKKKQSESMKKAYEREGNWNLGTKRTSEQRANISAALKALDKDAIYTPEVRQHMSDAHLGHQDSEETKQKKSNSAKEAWDKRTDHSRQCSVPGCEVSGKAKYKIIEGIRYCNKHGLRVLRYGRTNSLEEANNMVDQLVGAAYSFI